jgi:hypothetical protein
VNRNAVAATDAIKIKRIYRLAKRERQDRLAIRVYDVLVAERLHSLTDC